MTARKGGAATEAGAAKPTATPSKSWWLDLSREQLSEAAKARTEHMSAKKITGKSSERIVGWYANNAKR